VSGGKCLRLDGMALRFTRSPPTLHRVTSSKPTSSISISSGKASLEVEGLIYPFFFLLLLFFFFLFFIYGQK
jgi:hypothetical protein